MNLLYHRLRAAQAHMRISFWEGLVELADRHMTGGVELTTERTEVEEPGL